ncbi:hypothetical protein HPP92_009949 [Vanilla planifolia]|uniref:Glyoxal oxidase N-terminal domain-containing protein n=1 Tax=Vanilla planifolia TaxID=51239 RepID=A0A835R5G2_VANPL|nr:hypothetical protein HPP92_009949 [Vanilla planifolia]
MVITGDDPRWEMEDMPGPRLMSDMLLLPTGDVLLINGATHGCAGWEKAINPVLAPYLYKPKDPQGRRFSILRASEILGCIIRRPSSSPTAAFSSAVATLFQIQLLRVPLRHGLRLEAFTPHYMGSTTTS